MSHRVEQLEASIRRKIGELLARGLADPRVRGLITITEVKISDDKRQAVIGISVLPEEHADLTLKGITSAGKHLRQELAKSISVRRMPRLIFKLDDTLKKQARVIAAVNEAMADTGPAPDEDENDTTADDRARGGGQIGEDRSSPADEDPTQ